MRSLRGRLLTWVAERLDRHLLTVPEVDDYDPSYTDPTDSQHDGDVDRTRPILRELFASRAGQRPGFVQG